MSDVGVVFPIFERKTTEGRGNADLFEIYK